jgi:hypothetical protein
MVTRTIRLLILAALLLTVPGCGLIPEYRVGQKAVPPPVQKTPAQLEAERQAAELLARGIEEPPSLKPVAQGLSDSLGKPQKSLVPANPTREQVDTAALEAVARLEASLAKMQKQVDAQNKFLTKYAGTKLEGTGFDLGSWGGGALLIGLVVLAIACPPVMTLMFFAFRRLKAAASIVVNEMEAAAKEPEAKEAVAKIKERVAAKMQSHKQPTTALKAVITDLKS